MAHCNIEIGCVDFRSMRKRQLCYVDKTAFIAELLAADRPGVTLITRPRRFGKTLTLHMLKEFFDIRRKGTTSFDGLAIERNRTLCEKWMNKFPVLSLSLKDVGTGDFSRALGSLRCSLSDLCDEHGYLAESPRLTEQDRKDFQALTARQGDISLLASSLRLLCRFLARHWGSPSIVLIDEYDVPLARARQYGYQEAMTGFLRDFFGMGLQDNADLALAVLTGCLQTPGLRLFSGLDTIRCCGISDPPFADMFGFTSAEVDALLDQAGLPEKAPLLKEWYGGYRFGAHSDLCCPWDILQYLADCADNPRQTPRSYWIDTSSNIPLQQILAENRLPIAGRLRALARGEPVITDMDVEVGHDSLYASQSCLWSLLHQTGYLTRCPDARLAEMNRTLQSGQAALVLPNRELHTWLTTSVDNAFTDTLQQTGLAFFKAFFEAFWAPDEEAVSCRLTQLCSRTAGYRDYYEHFHKTLVLRLFQDDAVFNRERGPGRSDSIVHLSGTYLGMTERALIGIRTDRPGRETGTDGKPALEDLAMEACEELQQDLAQRDLAQCHASSNRPGMRILCWGVAFADMTCAARCRVLES